jgi:sugar phosphate permease
MAFFGEATKTKNGGTAVPTSAVTSEQEHRLHETEHVYARVTWKLVPLLFICYVVSYLDRINVGFAQLQMKSELSFSDTVYG